MNYNRFTKSGKPLGETEEEETTKGEHTGVWDICIFTKDVLLDEKVDRNREPTRARLIGL